MNDQSSPIAYSPNKRAFILTRIGISFFYYIVFFIVVLVLGASQSWLFLLLYIPAIVIIGIDTANTFAAFRKQKYEFSNSAVYYSTGHLFADKHTELRFDNVTHVRVIKPFIEYHLFGTGKILLDSAGSKASTVQMVSVDKPYEVFEDIKQILARDTFSLTYSELLSKKKPSPIAVLLQVVGSLGVVGLFLVGNIGLGSIASFFTGAAFFIVSLVVLLSIAGVCVYLYVLYQDQIRRTYYVYSDVIHYSKGYLTKQEAFMPAGNLANAELTQNLIGKILDLQDVVVSCQGQGSKIRFANLHNGQDLQRAVTSLINKREVLKKDDKSPTSQTLQARASSVFESGATPGQVASNFFAPPTPSGEDVSARDYYMQMFRAIAPFLIFIIIPPAFIAIAIAQVIAVKQTVFRLTDGGVSKYYSFLSTSNVELSRDKITGVIIKRNPFDRWLNTCTVTFWSIGSGTTVDFKYIPFDENTESIMKAKAGIVEDEELEIVYPEFSFKKMILANLYLNIFVALLVLALGVVLLLAWYPWFVLIIPFYIVLLIIYATSFTILHKRYKRSFMRLGQHTTRISIGYLFKQDRFTRNDNIKDITLTKYPSTSSGRVRLEIAGEHKSDNTNDGKSSGGVPNRFELDFMPNIDNEVHGKTMWFDNVLLHKPNVDNYKGALGYVVSSESVKRKSHPSLKNFLVTEVPIHVILFPLIVILPFSIYLRRFWLKRVDYIIEDNRIIKRWGVVFRNQTSMLYTRLDYTEVGQGFVNKVCKNGNVYLYAAGSSSAELVLNNLPDYMDFRESIKKQYGT